jgi:hypothetical protein
VQFGTSKIVDINEMKKKKQQQQDKQREDNFNWDLGGIKAKKAAEEAPVEEKKKAPTGSEIKFVGKYQILKNKAVGNKMEFPELGEVDKKEKQKEPVSKAN